MNAHYSEDPERGPFFLEAEEAVKFISEGATVIDVRTPEEFAEGHLVGAQLIPHTTLETELSRLEPLKDKQIVLYCKSGRRSNWAASFLREAGFEKAYNGGKYSELASQEDRG